MTMGCHVPSVEKVVGMCRDATKRPLIVKLTPNVTDITEIARAAEAAGADALAHQHAARHGRRCAPSPSAARARRRRFFSDLRSSPLPCAWFGSAIRPSTSRCSAWAESRTARMRSSSCSPAPTAVAVGTANFVNPHATIDVIDGIIAYCEEQGVASVSELIGALEC